MPGLDEVMRGHANPVQMLRNNPMGMYVYPVVAPEFRNWRSEQAAWRKGAVLFDQSHHMDELTVEGPQAEEFLAFHGINDFANFGLNRAKHATTWHARRQPRSRLKDAPPARLWKR